MSKPMPQPNKMTVDNRDDNGSCGNAIWFLAATVAVLFFLFEYRQQEMIDRHEKAIEAHIQQETESPTAKETTEATQDQ